MRQIHLSQDRFALVDDEDFYRFGDLKWFYQPNTKGASAGTAMRHIYTDEGKMTTEYLSRAITLPPPGKDVIFLNRNRLDFRRDNLQIVDKAHAQRHKKVRRDSISGIKGVRFNRKCGCWEATLWRNRKAIRLGRFNTARGAAEAFKNGVSRWEYLEANRLTDSVGF
jgi:hypothetical protein